MSMQRRRHTPQRTHSTEPVPTSPFSSLLCTMTRPPAFFALLLLITASCAVAARAAVPPAGDVPVRDTEGNPLRRGDPYYVLPVNYGDGGVNVGSIAGIDSPCPREVWLRPGPPAEPVMFFPNATDLRGRPRRAVLLEDLLLVMFAEVVPCPGSALWTVNDTTGYVTTGGAPPPASAGGGGGGGYLGFFRIGAYEVLGAGHYRLYSCPTPVAERPCSTIGATPVGGVKRFTFPLVVRFQRVPAEDLAKLPKNLHL